jgi:hypothetical protein
MRPMQQLCAGRLGARCTPDAAEADAGAEKRSAAGVAHAGAGTARVLLPCCFGPRAPRLGKQHAAPRGRASPAPPLAAAAGPSPSHPHPHLAAGPLPHTQPPHADAAVLHLQSGLADRLPPRHPARAPLRLRSAPFARRAPFFTPLLLPPHAGRAARVRARQRQRSRPPPLRRSIPHGDTTGRSCVSAVPPPSALPFL